MQGGPGLAGLSPWTLIWLLTGVRVLALSDAWMGGRGKIISQELGRVEAGAEHRLWIHWEAKPRQARRASLSALGYQLPPAKQKLSAGWLQPSPKQGDLL